MDTDTLTFFVRVTKALLRYRNVAQSLSLSQIIVACPALDTTLKGRAILKFSFSTYELLFYIKRETIENQMNVMIGH